jgi:hypothetical protein
MDFKWSIEKLQTSEDNLVIKVDWRVAATQNDLTASASGVRTLIRGDSFIPYEQLTEQQVLNWCFEPEVITWTDRDNVSQSITKRLKDEGEAQVTGQIERQLAQKQFEPALPWLEIPA